MKKSVITVKILSDGRQQISWDVNHPKAEQIKKWLGYRLSAGYIEYLLNFDKDPHCNACRDKKCESQGSGDDACRGFKYGEKW